mmetsp:Transcript_19762/g.65809  ORF Transcript_19762/g.65809 Transcript_19762/m.65809 type:complete len:207 (-) Transcript_19762:1286-1906(-)
MCLVWLQPGNFLINVAGLPSRSGIHTKHLRFDRFIAAGPPVPCKNAFIFHILHAEAVENLLGNDKHYLHLPAFLLPNAQKLQALCHVSQFEVMRLPSRYLHKAHKFFTPVNNHCIVAPLIPFQWLQAHPCYFCLFLQLMDLHSFQPYHVTSFPIVDYLGPRGKLQPCPSYPSKEQHLKQPTPKCRIPSCVNEFFNLPHKRFSKPLC